VEEKRIAALEEKVQELQREAGAQRFRGSLNSISIILLAVGTGIGFWRVHGYLIRISETVREAIKLIGEQGTNLSVVIQQVNDYLEVVSGWIS